METLKHICQKFKIDLKQESPIFLPIGRYKDIPELFNELGFKKGAEVGIYRGVYSSKLFKRIKDLELYGIDPWVSYEGYKDFEANDIADAEIEARKRYSGQKGGIIKATSRDAITMFEDESLDFVFIDGNHAYEYVVEDIALWSKKVRPGGIVMGHDYDDYSDSRKYAQMNVINAVNGWVASYKIHPLFVITNNRNKCWFYVK